MVFYFMVKKDDIKKFAGKWIEVKTVLLLLVQ